MSRVFLQRSRRFCEMAFGRRATLASRRLAIAIAMLSCLLLPTLPIAVGQEKTTQDKTAQAKPTPAKSEPIYLRISKSEAGKPKALETAIRHYTAKSDNRYPDAQVDLVGVIHIGEKAYYQELNQLLASYDAVLYELVAPDGTRIKPEDLEKRRSVLASMQTGMKDMLELEYQLAEIDYMAKNFVHADMSPEEFMKDMEQRGDDLWKMFARLMGAGLATQTGGEIGLLSALMSDNRAVKMKRVFAKQLIDAEAVTAGMDDANGENTLIKGRNRKAFEVLARELAAGKRKIAVFYGAGHLSDMAERLESEFGLVDQPEQTKWLTAWDLLK